MCGLVLTSTLYFSESSVKFQCLRGKSLSERALGPELNKEAFFHVSPSNKSIKVRCVSKDIFSVYQNQSVAICFKRHLVEITTLTLPASFPQSILPPLHSTPGCQNT